MSSSSLAGGLGRSLAGSGGAGGPRAILGPALVEYWDAELGIALASSAVDTWTGQKLGTVVQAPGAANRPSYGVDATYFGGRAVVQFSATHTLTSADVGVLLAAGSRPYILTIWRQRAAPLGGRLWQLNRSAGVDDQQALYIPQNFVRQYTGGVNQDLVLPAPTANSSAHFVECWLNATSGLNGSVDGVDVAPLGAATGSMDGDVRQVNFATLGTGRTDSNENASIAWFGLVSSQPTAGQRTALRAWARGRYGTP